MPLPFLPRFLSELKSEHDIAIMGSMKRKRRKKLKNEWLEFQTQHELSDSDIKLARQTGFPIKRFENLFVDEGVTTGSLKSQRIQQVFQDWQLQVAARQTAIAEGLIAPKKKPAKKPNHDPKWAKAKEVCRLNMDDIRKAKELGLRPEALIKNVPSPSQKWKAPVKIWIQELYQKRIVAKDKPG